MSEKKPIKIIVDSCCDLNPKIIEEIKEHADFSSVPLIVNIGDEAEFIDDGTVDIKEMIKKMKDSKLPATSACPSPGTYAEHMRDGADCFVVTLSSKLSGSFNSARLAAEFATEESPDKKILVIDSKSASAGETSIALFLLKKIKEGLSFDEISKEVEKFVNEVDTLFVLEDLNNLIKSGRLNKVSGILTSMFSICPIMADDGEGEIRVLARVGGMKNALKRLVEYVSEMTSTKVTKSVTLVLAYCQVPERAALLKQEILEKCVSIKDVVLVQTCALSSLYAGDGGVVLAF